MITSDKKCIGSNLHIAWISLHASTKTEGNEASAINLHRIDRSFNPSCLFSSKLSAFRSSLVVFKLLFCELVVFEKLFIDTKNL